MASESQTMRPSDASQIPRFVTIEVGKDDAIKFYLPAWILEEHSDYFKKSLNGPWKEAAEGHFRMEDIEPKIFAFFVDWIYTHKLPGSAKEWSTGVDKSIGRGKAQLAMAKAYALGDRLVAVDFCAMVEKALITKIVNQKSSPSLHAIAYVHENFQLHDIYATMIFMHCLKHRESVLVLDEWVNLLSREILLSIVMMYQLLLGQTDWSLCVWHKHATEEEEELCKVKTMADLVDDSDSDSDTDATDDTSTKWL